MISEKDKLAAKSVEQLKAAAKRLGGKLVTPDGKAKTKQQLINTIVMKNRLSGKSMGGNTTTKKVVAKKTVAKKPIVKKTTLGAKAYSDLPEFRSFWISTLRATNTLGARIDITDSNTLMKKRIPQNYKSGYMSQAKDYLNSLGIKVVGRTIDSLLSKNFDILLK
jgi:hypothetical protein